MTPIQVQPERLHELYDQHVLPEIQRGLVLGVVEGYRATWDHAKQLEDEVQRQGWSNSRWIGVDSSILAVGKRFVGLGVQSRYAPNTDDTHVCHTELTIGPFIITVGCVQDRTDLPRPAAYRELLVEANEGLFGPQPQRSDKLWVPLLHIPDMQRRLPRSIFAAFPSGMREFAVGHIDLLARYPIGGSQVENIADAASPMWRIKTEKGS